MIAAEDAGLYRDGLGAVPPQGFPAAFLEPVTGRCAGSCCATPASHGPFAAEELSRPLGRRR